MNQKRKNYIYHVFILKEYLREIFGYHYPIEIIKLIIMSTYTFNKIICGFLFSILIDEKIYFMGCDDYEKRISDDSSHKPTIYEGTDINIITHGMYKTIALVYSHDIFQYFRKKFILNENYFVEFGGGHKVDLPNNKITLIEKNKSDIISISCGRNHNVALRKCGSLYIWGDNEYGQLGWGSLEKNLYTSPIHGLFSQCGLAKLPYHDFVLDELIILVRCGNYHTIALAKSSMCYVWGSNEYGQLGLGHRKNQIAFPLQFDFFQKKSHIIIDICCGGNHTIALTAENKIYAWGNNKYYQLGLGDDRTQCSPKELMLRNIIAINCGIDYTVALSTSGKLYVWGCNDHGELGLGHNRNQKFPRQLILSEEIKSISCGQFHMACITVYDKIFIWGWNEYGQLGLGDNINRNSPQEIMF